MSEKTAKKTGVKSKNSDKLAAYLAPLVFAFYPTLFFYANNIEESQFSWISTPLLIALIATPILLIIVAQLAKNIFRASLIVTVFWILFFSYGRFFSYAETNYESFNNHILVGLLWLVIFGLLMFLLTKLKSPDRLVRASLFVGLVMTAIQVVTIVTYTRPTDDTNSYEHLREETSKTIQTDENLPNFYYILLDSYPREDVLDEYFDYDNSPFVDALVGLGFYDAKNSNANYNHTYLTMDATLNMSYLINTEVLDNSIMLNLYQKNKVMDYLDEQYSFVNNSSFFPAVYNPNADININCAKTNEFLFELASTTALLPLQNLAEETRSTKRDDALCTIDNIDSRASGPSFVFTHLIPPHPPYLFDAEGNDTSEVNISLTGWTRWLAKEPYIEQLKYLNTRLLEKVGTIVAEDPGAVIIIQSDHGTLSSATEKVNLSDTRDIVLKERSRNITYIRLPDSCSQDGLYDSITNVNTFRLIFNNCFGEDYELLDDIVYYATGVIQKDDSVDITDIVR